MNKTPGLLTAVVSGARWTTPWLSVLAISVSVAYAVTVAMGGGAPAGDTPATSVVAAAAAPASGVPGWSAATPSAIDRFSSEEACDTSGGRLLYVGLNSWIPAEPNVTPCPENVP